jgi:delta24(24(1))-sterol reductase
VTPPQRDGGSHEEPRSTPPPGASSGPTDAGSCASGDRLEFGGAPGALAIITLSHLVAYYVLLCVAKRQGRLYPLPLSSAAFAALLADLRELAAPTPASWAVYLGFLGTQLALALVCPGPVVHGYPVTKSGERADDADDAAGKKKNARRLPYKCNALSAWWVTLLTVGLGTVVFGDAPLVWVADNRGRLLTCAVCVGDVGSLVFYLKGVLAREKDASSGLSSSQKKTKKKNILYDFFMGTELNPRSFGDKLDWKMFAELRVSWVTLFLLTASAAAKQARARREAAFFLSQKLGDDFLSAAVARAVTDYPYVSSASLLLLAAHWLYANACQKGEACVPYTWDVFHEKFGWMLLWWNVVLPFVYSATSFVVAETDPRLSSSTTALLWVTLLSAYYVWDVAQAQRVTFRARRVAGGNRTKTKRKRKRIRRVPGPRRRRG